MRHTTADCEDMSEGSISVKNTPHSLRFAAIIAAIALIVVSAGLAFRDSSAQTSSSPDQHPVQIRNGTCSTPGEIAFNLSPISDAGLINGTAMAQDSEIGATNELPLQQSDSTVGVSLQDLVASDHSIQVSLTAADMDNFLVCGSIGGRMLGQADLSIGLAEANGSGYIGVANLHDNGDGTTAVWIFLAQSTAVAPQASPVPGAAATPVPAQPAASPQAQPSPVAGGGQAQSNPTIEMVDIAFKPNDVTIAANTDVTVTLKNSGALPHNFSITDKNNPNVPNLNISVDVQPGQSQTVTINAPAGDYYFFCNVSGHEAAGMYGTLHVQ
jgi:plastocyanin